MQGFIDYVDSGFVSGWAVDNSQQGYEKLLLEVNGKVAQKISGTQFRQDVLEGGIGDGKCGFLAHLNDISLGEDIVIRVLNDVGQPIPGMTFETDNTLPKIKFTHISSKDFNISFHAHSNEDRGELRFKLFSGDKEVLAIGLHVPEGISTVNIPIPAVLIDNQIHQLSIGVAGYPKAIWRGEETFNNVTTPWQYLKSAENLPGLIGACPQATYRYESLKLILNNLPLGLNIDDVLNAHDVLVEGWESRTEFPKLKLPKFENPKVSVVIPAYNKFEISYHTIASIILSPTNVSYEVILADDCSTDETAVADNFVDNLVLINNSENMMFLRSCNNAALSAKGEYVLFLNNDTEVTSYWLDELIEPMEQDPSIGLTGSKLLNADGSLQEAGGIVWNNGAPWNVGNGDNPKKPEFNYSREVDYLSGAALCVRSSVWEEVEGFSDYLAPAYFEDTDIAFKVRAAGYRTLYTPHSEVFHFEGMSHGRDLTKGIKKNQVINAKNFAAKWSKVVKHNGKEGESLHLNKDRNIEKRILVFDYTTPSPNEDAGSYAAVQEIKLLQGLGFKVTFVPQNIAHLGKLTKQLQKMGVEVLFGPFYSSLEMVVNQRIHEMDAVYITRYTVAEVVMPMIKSVNPSIPVLFNNADLHFLREIRAALNTKDDEALEQAKVTRDKELAVMRQVDAILSYNETEHAVITSHILEQDKVHRCPWVLEDKPNGPEFSERNGIAFLGGYRHTPNVEAVDYFVNKIAPLLKEQAPDIKLYVYGSHMPKEFDEYEVENIEFVGFAESLDDVYHNHKIFIAPLLSGAGIKGKVLESMAYGTPCVLTNVAAEGTGLTNDMSALFAETPEAWVQQITKLYNDQTLWRKLSENQKVLVEQKFTYEVSLEQMRKTFASVGIYC